MNFPSDASRASLHLFHREVLILAVHESPNFVSLNTANAQIANMSIVISSSTLRNSAKILVRGFARVGIIALVDEATGYQADRARDALAKILEEFVAKELRKWVRTFPGEFYREMFRLRKIPYTGSVKKPQYIGHLTNDLVYARLAPGVLDELRRVTPRNEKGQLKHRLFQRLTEDVGHPKLREHLASVIALMKAADTWDQFMGMMDRSLRKYKELPLFDGQEDRAFEVV